MSQNQNLIRLRCPRLSCRSVLAVPTKARGKLVRCKSCGATIKVPASSKSPASPAPAADAEQDAA